MAPLSGPQRDAVREALDTQLRNEEFERALGRTLRRRGRGFEEYVAITTELRERSRKDGTSMEAAARALCEESDQE